MYALALFALPMIIGNLFQQTYTMVDSAIVGRYVSEQALAAVGASYSLTNVFICVAIGGGMGASVVVSRHFGAKAYDRMKTAVYTALLTFLVISILLGSVGLLCGKWIMNLLQTPSDVLDLSVVYLNIYFLGLPFLFMYNVLSAMFNALGKSRIPLYFLVFSSIFNVGLDIFMVKSLHMGVSGVAWATLIAQGISAVLCFIYIVKKFPILHLKKENFRFSLPACGKLMALGVPMALQFSITAIGTIIVQGAVNVYGEDYMAGFSAAAKIQNVICTVFVAFGATIATYVGQNWGAGKVDRVRQGVRCTQIMILAYSVIAIILVFFFSKYLTYLFISPSETKVIEVSVLYFHTVFWCYPFLGSIFLYRNTLQGLGYGLVPMLGGVFELVARSAIVVLVAGKTSFAGVCLSDPAAWISALIPLIPYYIYVTRKWKKQGKIVM